MWLRSERRENRLRRADTKSKSKTKSKCFRNSASTGTNGAGTTSAASASSSITTSNVPSKISSQKKNFSDKYVKCNKLKPKVKRLVNKIECPPTRRRTTRAATAANHKAPRGTLQNIDTIGNNIAGQLHPMPTVDSNSADEKITSSSSCSCAEIDGQSAADRLVHEELTKCISECDSTTDYEQQNRLAESAPIANTTTAAITCCSQLKSLQPPAVDIVQSEVDSTTDLLQDDAAAIDTTVSTQFLQQEQLKPYKRLPTLPKLALPTSTTYPPIIASCSNYVAPTTIGGIDGTGVDETTTLQQPNTSSADQTPATPDLISLFDEEINKSTTDICPYTDFFPYNNILTQALLSCNEATGGALCETTDVVGGNVVTDPNFLASINQTAIDNLKALTNLQNHTTNFLSGISLTKPSDIAAGGFIHSAIAPPPPSSIDMMTISPQLHIPPPPPLQIPLSQSLIGVHSLAAASSAIVSAAGGIVAAITSGNSDNNSNDIQLETDECMEIEEIHDHRHEEMVWEAFDPYVFIKHLPPLTMEMRAKCPALPLKTRSSPEFSLVLDLDETLVHCSLQELSDASFKFPVLFQVTVLFFYFNCHCK